MRLKKSSYKIIWQRKYDIWYSPDLNVAKENIEK